MVGFAPQLQLLRAQRVPEGAWGPHVADKQKMRGLSGETPTIGQSHARPHKRARLGSNTNAFGRLLLKRLPSEKFTHLGTVK